jgi:hypothetical protein
MKIMVCLIWLSATVALCCLPVHAEPQSSHQSGGTNPNQWISHQMNQPPPTRDNNTISQDRMDEVRDLYLQAKQEAEKKAAARDNEKK